MSTITIDHDLRSQFGTARDQGLRPTCLAFATSDAHAAARDTKWSALSCEYLYFHAVQRRGSSHTAGAGVSSMREALEQDGQPFESGWPYLKAVPKDWKPPAMVGKVFRRTSQIISGGIVAARKKVVSGKPVVIGMSISDAFFSPKDGVIDSTEAVDPLRRHAVIAVATGELSGANFLMVRNSWGEKWGLGGYAWIAERYLKPRIVEMVTVD